MLRVVVDDEKEKFMTELRPKRKIRLRMIKAKKPVGTSTIVSYDDKFTYKYKYLTQLVDMFISGYSLIIDDILLQC
jgi:hypothetical protein